MTSTLYKYRTIENFKFFVEILINKKLFAGKFKDMNDPMEGLYLYSEGRLNQNVRNKLFEEKNAATFCCLSKEKDNYLMWAHYSNGHRGVVIGVQIDEAKYEVKDIEYFTGLTHIDKYDRDTSREILSRKLNLWEYEKEVRVFSKDFDNNIQIVIKEIILGINMNLEDEMMIKNLVKMIDPEIYVHKNYR